MSFRERLSVRNKRYIQELPNPGPRGLGTAPHWLLPKVVEPGCFLLPIQNINLFSPSQRASSGLCKHTFYRDANTSWGWSFDSLNILASCFNLLPAKIRQNIKYRAHWCLSFPEGKGSQHNAHFVCNKPLSFSSFSPIPKPTLKSVIYSYFLQQAPLYIPELSKTFFSKQQQN